VTVTVAVRVTGCPDTEGLALEASAVVVAAALTVWERAVEVAARKAPSPG